MRGTVQKKYIHTQLNSVQRQIVDTAIPTTKVPFPLSRLFCQLSLSSCSTPLTASTPPYCWYRPQAHTHAYKQHSRFHHTIVSRLLGFFDSSFRVSRKKKSDFASAVCRLFARFDILYFIHSFSQPQVNRIALFCVWKCVHELSAKKPDLLIFHHRSANVVAHFHREEENVSISLSRLDCILLLADCVVVTRFTFDNWYQRRVPPLPIRPPHPEVAICPLDYSDRSGPIDSIETPRLVVCVCECVCVYVDGERGRLKLFSGITIRADSRLKQFG